jgi:hypothetical protein
MKLLYLIGCFSSLFLATLEVYGPRVFLSVTGMLKSLVVITLLNT